MAIIKEKKWPMTDRTDLRGTFVFKYQLQKDIMCRYRYKYRWQNKNENFINSIFIVKNQAYYYGCLRQLILEYMLSD